MPDRKLYREQHDNEWLNGNELPQCGKYLSLKNNYLVKSSGTAKQCYRCFSHAFIYSAASRQMHYDNMSVDLMLTLKISLHLFHSIYKNITPSRIP